jgi:site-specific recombinase XerD
MGVIYKRGDNWYLDVRANGRRIRKRVGHSKKIAELALKDAEVKIAREEFGFFHDDIPIETLLAKYLEYSQAHHAQGTFRRYRGVVEHFRRFLKGKPELTMLSHIQMRQVDEYKVFRKGELVNPNGCKIESEDDITNHTRKGARAYTINFEICTIRTMLYMAVKWGYLKENPVRMLNKLKVNDSKKPRFLSIEECRLLLKNSPEHLRPIFYMFLTTGMRKGELENLEWSDIDLKRRRIKIQRKDFWKPKTGEREIPINQGTLDLLVSLKKQNDKSLKSRFVFPDPFGAKIKTKLREQLIKVAEKAGIENLTKLHALRHTYASQLVMSGVDLPTVQKLMGHEDIQTTMIYSHLAQDHLAEAVEKLKL